jgi:integrase
VSSVFPELDVRGAWSDTGLRRPDAGGDRLPVRAAEHNAILSRGEGTEEASRTCTLITTLLDNRAAPAEIVGETYLTRWSASETTFGEAKTTITGAGNRTSGPVLRSGSPRLVMQEAHAAVISRVLAIPAKRYDKPEISFLTEQEAAALTAAPDQERWQGRRDRALIVLTLQAGLRVSEITSLSNASITFSVGAHVSCTGKGRKQRAVPLTKPTQTVLRAWVDERGGDPGDPLFPTRTGRRLSRDAIERRIAIHAATAAASCPTLAGKKLHPHVLRHTCVICTASPQ